MSRSCLLCCLLPDLVPWRSAVDKLTRPEKVPGLFPSAALCSNPSMAISRLLCRGAKLNWNSASSTDVLSSLRNISWHLFQCVNTVLQAWNMAAVPYSKYGRNSRLYTLTSSPCATKHAVHAMDATFQAASVIIFTTASHIVAAWSKGTRSNRTFRPSPPFNFRMCCDFCWIESHLVRVSFFCSSPLHRRIIAMLNWSINRC